MRALNEVWESAETLEGPRLDELDRLLAGLSPSALYWAAGYVHARARAAGAQPEGAGTPVKLAATAARLTIIYGSQTGNAKRVAEELAARAESQGLLVRVVRADAYPVRELADERALLIAISTQGDGDPPDDSRAFLRFLMSARAPKLPSLRYAVIGLGDSSYPKFCYIGLGVDARLAALGASRLAPRADADVDIERVATPFSRAAIEAARAALEVPANRGAKVTSLRPAPVGHSRSRPFAAMVLANQRLTARDSELSVHHLELDLAGSGLRYQPGDALGIWPQQDAALVTRVIEIAGLTPDALVSYDESELPLQRWLAEKRELTRLSRGALVQIAERSANAELTTLLADTAATADYLARHQLIDLLERFAPRLSAADWVAILPPLQPRLYSIASSTRQVGDEVHLTVAERVDAVDGELRYGVASRLLLQLEEGARVPVYIESNERFRVPAAPERDLIMIGPGTGVAPFRAFLQERAALSARGRDWLFFGHRHLRREFLYQTEWLAALQSGRLARLDVAFSRDGPERIYVQHLLRKHATELVAWLDGGAHLYVCGDATRMAKDVHQALIEILAEVRGISTDDAVAELEHLADQGRYSRDVY
jgi:sulfite reductase (NADPH) flavoprotein alpha-component